MRQAAENRMVKGTTQNRAEVEPAVEESAHAAELLTERLALARRLVPPASALCRDCWLHGRDEAVKAGKAGGLEAVAVAAPGARDHQHNRKAWDAGRDAVLEYLTA